MGAVRGREGGAQTGQQEKGDGSRFALLRGLSAVRNKYSCTILERIRIQTQFAIKSGRGEGWGKDGSSHAMGGVWYWAGSRPKEGRDELKTGRRREPGKSGFGGEKVVWADAVI